MVGCESLTELLKFEYLCISTRISLLELHFLLSVSKCMIEILIEGFSFGFMGHRVG